MGADNDDTGLRDDQYRRHERCHAHSSHASKTVVTAGLQRP
jgi:hypothetical protein